MKNAPLAAGQNPREGKKKRRCAMKSHQNKKTRAALAALLAALVAAGLPGKGWAQKPAETFSAASVASEYFSLAAKCPSGECPDETTANRANRLAKLANANCYAAYGATEADKATACQAAVAKFPTTYKVGTPPPCPAGERWNGKMCVRKGTRRCPAKGQGWSTDLGRCDCTDTSKYTDGDKCLDACPEDRPNWDKKNGKCSEPCPKATPIFNEDTGECEKCPKGQTFADGECGCHEDGKPYYNSDKGLCQACSQAFDSLPYWDGEDCTECPARTMWDGTVCKPCESGANWMSVKPTDTGRCVTCNPEREVWDESENRCVPLSICPDGQPHKKGTTCKQWSPSFIGWYDPAGKKGFWDCPKGQQKIQPWSSMLFCAMEGEDFDKATSLVVYPGDHNCGLPWWWLLIAAAMGGLTLRVVCYKKFRKQQQPQRAGPSGPSPASPSPAQPGSGPAGP